MIVQKSQSLVLLDSGCLDRQQVVAVVFVGGGDVGSSDDGRESGSKPEL